MSFTSWLQSLALDSRPLRVPAFRHVFIGQAVAMVGTVVTQVTVPVQVFSLTRSSWDVGLVGLAGLLPVLTLGLYGGALADAVDRRSLYRASTAVTWICTLLLALQAAIGLGSVPAVLALVAVQSAGFAVSSAVRGAIIPALVEPAHLPAANALFYTAGNVGQVAGPLLAGALLVLPHGDAVAYTVDALLFTAVLAAALRLPRLPRPTVTSRAPGWRSVVEGLRFLGARPVLLAAFAVDVVAMVLAMPQALFPQAAADRVHGNVGVIYAAVAAGSVLAGLASGWIGRVRRLGLLLGAAGAVWAAAICAAGLSRSLWWMSALLVLAGGADLISAVCRQTILQSAVPDRLRGRLQGVYIVVVTGGPRLGDLRAGAMAATTTFSLAWSGSAALGILVIAAITALVPAFRQYRAPRAG